MFCIDKSLSFISDDNLRLVSSWITDGKVTVDDQELDTKLTPDQKYAIIKSVFASRCFTDEEKQALRAKTFEGDTSDKAHQA